jgi:hypothetical protein
MKFFVIGLVGLTVGEIIEDVINNYANDDRGGKLEVHLSQAKALARLAEIEANPEKEKNWYPSQKDNKYKIYEISVSLME